MADWSTGDLWGYWLTQMLATPTYSCTAFVKSVNTCTNICISTLSIRLHCLEYSQTAVVTIHSLMATCSRCENRLFQVRVRHHRAPTKLHPFSPDRGATPLAKSTSHRQTQRKMNSKSLP